MVDATEESISSGWRLILPPRQTLYQVNPDPDRQPLPQSVLTDNPDRVSKGGGIGRRQTRTDSAKIITGNIREDQCQYRRTGGLRQPAAFDRG